MPLDPKRGVRSRYSTRSCKRERHEAVLSGLSTKVWSTVQVAIGLFNGLARAVGESDHAMLRESFLPKIGELNRGNRVGYSRHRFGHSSGPGGGSYVAPFEDMKAVVSLYCSQLEFFRGQCTHL